MKPKSILIYFTLLVCIQIFSINVYSQETKEDKERAKELKKTKKEAEKLVKSGDKYLENGDLKSARNSYLSASRKDPTNAMAFFKTGDMYLRTPEKKKSLTFLQKAFELNEKVDQNLLYYLARSLHFNEKFDEALNYYIRFKQNVKPSDSLYKKVTLKIEQCKVAKELVDDPIDVLISNIGAPINTDNKEYDPVISADESVLMFTSRRPGSTGEKTDDFGEFFEDIYISYNNNGTWSEPQNMGPKINKKDHDACISLSADGQTLFIYKGIDEINGDIYESKLKGTEWSKPKEMDDVINSKFWEGSCCLSADGNRFYFVSDKPGGFGGKDIYVSEKNKKGKWQDPVNLGPNINTDNDEDGVFLHPDGQTLYFSSEGHKSSGGFDIFKSTWTDNSFWSEPKNIGYPVNTPDNDVFFVLSANGEHGYYASEKEGNLDIYLIKFPKPFRAPEPPALATKAPELAYTPEGVPYEIVPKKVSSAKAYNPLTMVKGTVTDADTKLPIGATIQLVDNAKNELLSEIEANEATGKYMVMLPSGKNYGIAIQKEKYLFHSENFDIPENSDYQEITKDVQLKKMDVGKKIVLKNIFFDTGKWTLRQPESTNELDRLVELLDENKKLMIEISGHTDNIGKEDYNKTLSENRAKAVVDYLVEKGIKAERLKYAGYWYSRPIASNDNIEGRQQNRRTEFEVLGN
ncbi:MAG: hypothetical protein A3G23_08350 [Bacteroidetes bacterium RIFCSPLOWO2_12_FULL_37_12]|nr:MAG: hypothetical protein A3G23_08350 [Bacteroidetes bacterium RIFCSPLOWO2_12_FULL_37_12]